MPREPDYYNFILPPYEQYCIPGLNEIKFISEKQTLSLVLGSCTSTVLIGKGEKFILGANHIVLANPAEGSRVASKGAFQQIEEMIQTFNNVFNISTEDILCFHLTGGGRKKEDGTDDDFDIHIKNINAAVDILAEKEIPVVFNDTGSYFVSKYSIKDNFLSVFVENKFNNEHISFIVDMLELFKIDQAIVSRLPISSIERSSEFEYLIDEEVITFITGKRNR